MINLKTHNDMVEKLISDNDRLQKELKQLEAKLRKAQSIKELENLKDKELGKRTKDDVGKLTKLQKQFKDKIDQMNKIVMARDLEITELKERLDTKLNIDQKEKQHLIETFRKWQGRKPNSSNDYKVMSVINHYENQIEKLTKQMQHFKSESVGYQDLTRTLRRQLLDKENQDINIDALDRNTNILKEELDSKVTQFEVEKIQKQLSRKNKKIQTMEKQCAQLRTRYEDLLKEYYKMMNEYGDLGRNDTANTTRTFKKGPNQSGETKRCNPPVKHMPFVETVLRKMPEYNDEGQQSEISFEYSHSSRAPLPVKQISHPPVRQFSEEQSTQLQHYKSIINRLMEIHQLRSEEEIVPACIKLDVAIKNLPKMQNCLTTIKQSMEKMLGCKINLSKIADVLNQLQAITLESQSNNTLIRNIEVSLGTKKQTIPQGIDKILKENEEYYNSLKSISYIKSLEISKQIQQFIDFFGLQSDKPLPEQLTALYKQLKSLNTFVQITNKILETNMSVPECLEHVMRLIEKMKMGNQTVDYDTLTKLQQELQVDRHNLLPRVKELLKKSK